MKETFYVDIDRTLFIYPDPSTGKTEPSIIPDTKLRLQQMKDEGHCIVLTTSLPDEKREEVIFDLTKNNIPYTMLVTGIPSGDKHLY